MRSQSRCLPYKRGQVETGIKGALRIVAVTRRGRTGRAIVRRSENDKPNFKAKQFRNEAEHSDVHRKVDVGQAGKG